MATALRRSSSGYTPAQGQPSRAFVGMREGGGSSTPDIVKYRPPAYDEAKIKAYQQEAMAPGISRLRRLTREGMSSRYASPSARREGLRGLMRGYGEALAPLQAGAGAQARQRYDIQYQQKIIAERQRVAAEERANEREYQESLRDEAEVDQEEADRVIIGYNAAGFPMYGTREEAARRSMLLTNERQPSQIIGLTEASRRPISDEPEYGRSLYPEPVSPEPAYPTNWMT